MIIRKEETKDYTKVYDLIKEAFSTAEHADGNEQDLVVQLRKSIAFIPELSLVAVAGNILIGHILFTKATIGKKTVLALAPLSVKSGYQKQGVGTKLIETGHEIARQMGYDYAIVVGSEQYYPKFGYITADHFCIEILDGIPKENFMAIKLNPNAEPIQGNMIYPKEFGI